MNYAEKMQIINQTKMESVLDQTLRLGGQLCLVVTGNSMRPFLRPEEDRVLLCKAKKIRKGDIVLYRRNNGAYILHRAVKVGATEFYAAGDAQGWREGPIPLTRTEGVVWEIHRGNKCIRADSWFFQMGSRIWMAMFPLRWLRTKRTFKKRNCV